jgi:hypothetical protein
MVLAKAKQWNIRDADINQFWLFDTEYSVSKNLKSVDLPNNDIRQAISNRPSNTHTIYLVN